jgi:hypothetical protein
MNANVILVLERDKFGTEVDTSSLRQVCIHMVCVFGIYEYQHGMLGFHDQNLHCVSIKRCCVLLKPTKKSLDCTYFILELYTFVGHICESNSIS